MVLALTACSEESDAEKIQSLEDSGALPKLDRSDSIAGPDTNADGIRDDVEAFIVASYPGDTQRAAARQLAKVVQATLLVDKTDNTAVKAFAVRSSRAVHCIYSQFSGTEGSTPPSQVVRELSAVSANTKPRLLAYLAYAKALDGTAGALPEGDTCE